MHKHYLIFKCKSHDSINVHQTEEYLQSITQVDHWFSKAHKHMLPGLRNKIKVLDVC